MASAIDATKPVDNTPALKSDLRANLATAKSEIEALQAQVTALSSAVSGTRNRILNPSFRIDRRALGTVSVTPTTKTFLMDKWQIGSEVAAGATVSATTVSAFGNKVGLQVTTTSAKASLASTDRTWIAQTIESGSMADLAWGSSAAQSLVLSFYCRVNTPSTYAVALQSNGFGRSRIQTFSVPLANTWVLCTVQFPGDTGGAWGATATTFWTVRFDLGTGSFYQGSAGVWTSADVRTTSGAFAMASFAASTYAIADVQLEVGTAATSFERRTDMQELLFTGRYYETGQFNLAGYQLAASVIQHHIQAIIPKRTTPTVTVPSSPSNVTGAANTPTPTGFLLSGTATATGAWSWASTYIMDADQSL